MPKAARAGHRAGPRARRERRRGDARARAREPAPATPRPRGAAGAIAKLARNFWVFAKFQGKTRPCKLQNGGKSLMPQALHLCTAELCSLYINIEVLQTPRMQKF